jgi:hypothetical protein
VIYKKLCVTRAGRKADAKRGFWQWGTFRRPPALKAMQTNDRIIVWTNFSWRAEFYRD